jgi:asparagine synthase (glutamine-hydrolysing)
MCGIAGVFSPSKISQKDIDTISRMNELQKHRGPDDAGLYADDFCVLGHRRLSIIDLSSDGHQPFQSEDGRYYLVYNGEIYNYIEIRRELEAKKWRFRTKTDTEVLLKAYLEYGEDCLSHFNGMFAFALYDTKEHTLFLARDRVGVKPLYYTQFQSKFYFSSEIKAFKAIAGLPLTACHQSLFDYLCFNRTDVFDETFVKEIKRLPKGHNACYSNGTLIIKQWWNPETFASRQIDDPEETIFQTIEDIFISAINLRMRSDVPVGSCLSGGLDSSIIVGALAQTGQTLSSFKTFTASFPGTSIDETKYVDALSLRYPFENYRIYPTAESALEYLKAFVYTNDEPTTSPLRSV